MVTSPHKHDVNSYSIAEFWLKYNQIYDNHCTSYVLQLYNNNGVEKCASQEHGSNASNMFYFLLDIASCIGTIIWDYIVVDVLFNVGTKRIMG